MRQLLVAAAIVALGAGSTACATKKYVNTKVDDVNGRVSTLSESVEETQDRTRKNEAKITEVDQKADTANTRAGEATAAAERANSAAATAEARAVAIENANKRLVYEVVLTDENSRFKFGRATVSDEAKVEIDKVVQQLTADPKNVFIEIEGHTDNVGATTLNDRLGMERAEAVKRYLYEQHNIPLHKMNVISYGETKPVAPNKTRDGRAQNRRVVIKVLT